MQPHRPKPAPPRPLGAIVDLQSDPGSQGSGTDACGLEGRKVSAKRALQSIDGTPHKLEGLLMRGLATVVFCKDQQTVDAERALVLKPVLNQLRILVSEEAFERLKASCRSRRLLEIENCGPEAVGPCDHDHRVVRPGPGLLRRGRHEEEPSVVHGAPFGLPPSTNGARGLPATPACGTTPLSLLRVICATQSEIASLEVGLCGLRGLRELRANVLLC
mmetsp:Transcript_34239/g.61618  ORF Transcript_34239/g.61618 Transcript_34239/m.61618 type:complete len:218 (+) Transcript_34239:682-1335(+)